MSQENQGYISLHRKVMQNFLFKEKRTFSKFEAWIYLLMNANHSDTKILLGNQLIEVKKGSFITSEIKLMAEFSWSKSKLRTFLSLLESQSMIEKVSDSKKTTLSIVKYSDYQDSQTAKRPRKDREPTAKRPRADTDNNENNYNNDNNENNINTTNVELMSHTKFDFSGFNDFSLASDLWKTWIEYKSAQHRDKFKTPQSEQMAINALQKLCLGDTAIAKQIIEQSMANLYKGLFPLKQQQSNNNQISTKNGTPKQQPHAFIRKTLRNLERLGTFNSRQVEIAEYYLEHATGPINSEEFFGKLEQLDWSSPAFYPENIGDTLRLGERQDNRPTFELDN
jgi:hypothetical protein